MSVTTIEINRQPVELFKVLKFEGLCSSGAQAKAAVAAGMVLVNGETELRKRRKMSTGDQIVFAGQAYVLKHVE